MPNVATQSKSVKGRIAIIASTNYSDFPVGGIMSYLNEIYQPLLERYEVDLWGVETSDINVSRAKDYCKFAAVKTKRKIVPNLLRVVWGLYKNINDFSPERYDAVYIHGIPLVLPFLALKRKPLIINHIHGITNPFSCSSVIRPVRHILFHIYEQLRALAIRKSDAIFLAADTQGFSIYLTKYPFTPPATKIENFCDQKVFFPAPVEGQRSKSEINSLIFLGRMSADKDPDLAISIFSYYLENVNPSAKMYMVGDGPLLGECIKRVAHEGLSTSIFFMGSLPRENVADLLRQSDVLLYTSHANGYPLAIAEASACGLPTICCNVTGVHDLVIHKKTGMIVETRNPEDFKDPLIYISKNLDKMSASVTLNSERYSKKVIVKKILIAIDHILESANPHTK